MRALRVGIGLLTAVALIALLALSALRFVDSEQPQILTITLFSAYALVGYVVLLVVYAAWAWAARRREDPMVLPLVGVGIALVMILAHLVWIRPWLTSSDASSTNLRVVSANLDHGHADARILAYVARSADVVVLQEVTQPELVDLQKAGLPARFRFRAGGTQAQGAVVFSRYRLTGAQPLGLDHASLSVRVAAPRPFLLYAVHVATPLKAPQVWADDFTDLRKHLQVDSRKGPVLAVGDWNATYSHVPMRRMLDAGVRDAAEDAGTWQPTWPTKWRSSWLRPLVAIDHLLMSKEFVAVRTRTAVIPQTDHLALLVDLHF